MTAPLLVLNSGPCEAAFNMAFDEALLTTASSRSHATLRFYGWTERAATFGYFQKFTEIEAITRLRPLIRRPTGGGLVPHDRDWTYSLAVPPDTAWYQLSAIESYRTMHAWVVESFARLGAVLELADCCRKVAPGQCFQGWEKFDVLGSGRKIGGAAQRRNKLGLLIQGSLQPPPQLESRRGDWEEAMRSTAPAGFFSETRGLAPDSELLDLAADLARRRYRDPAYNTSR